MTTEPGQRGFASPPDRLDERLGPVRAWVLLHAGRETLALLLLAATLALLVGATLLPSVDLVAAMDQGDPVTTLFQALVGSILTGVTLVVTIAQLVLSQELGPLGDQRQRVEGALDFRERAAELLDVPAPPPEPAVFMRAIAERTSDHAERLAELAAAELDDGDGDGERDRWREVHHYTELVRSITDEVGEELRGTQFGTFAVMAASLELAYSYRLYYGRRLLGDEDGPLQQEQHAAARAELQHVVELLALFAPTREHIKTLYFEWDLINLSRRILALAGPALVVAVAALLLLDGPTPAGGSTMGVSNAAWLVATAATVALAPFALLASYVLRIVTVAKLTLAAGPFVLREGIREREADWDR